METKKIEIQITGYVLANEDMTLFLTNDPFGETGITQNMDEAFFFKYGLPERLINEAKELDLEYVVTVTRIFTYQVNRISTIDEWKTQGGTPWQSSTFLAP